MVEVEVVVDTAVVEVATAVEAALAGAEVEAEATK